MLKKRASEQARQANMTADEKEQARQGTNRSDFIVSTIYGKALLIDKGLTNFLNHLGRDNNATVKAVTAAITKYGYYPYFGDVNCKLSTLDDYIERAPKDQRGKNGHFL
jgi:hypothetical protein